MPQDKATVRRFRVGEDATYTDCRLTWDTASNTFTVYDRLNCASPIIQESFGKILKVLYTFVGPLSLTLVMNLKRDSQGKPAKPSQLVFLFNKGSSAFKFHKALLTLGKDYPNCNDIRNAPCAW